MADEDPLTVALIVIGVILIIAAIFLPSQSVEIILKPFSMIVEATPEGFKIKGTGIDAAVLEFAIGALLLVLGLMRRRRES